MKLLFATQNQGKVAELRALLGDDIEVVSLDQLAPMPSPEETGATFEANAELKARAYAQATGLASLADDSGLCVDALDGAPGVYSARYVEGTDADRTAALLTALKDEPQERRTAAFRCALCLVLPSGKAFLEVGECRGRIRFDARGENGFGYDPVFELPSGKTMAELTKAQKSAVSHRGEAFRKMRPHLAALF